MMNDVYSSPHLVVCFILLVIVWSHYTSVTADSLPKDCQSMTKPARDGQKWTFCINNERHKQLISKYNFCATEQDVFSINDFQFYENDTTCPKDFSGFTDTPTYNATCLQAKNKQLAKFIVEGIINIFSGKNMSELKNKTVTQSDLKVVQNKTYRLVVDYLCHTNGEDKSVDICDNTTKREMTEVEINLRNDIFSNEKNVSECSCSITSTSDLTIFALDVRLKHTNSLKLSSQKSVLEKKELYWIQDGNLIEKSQEVNVTLSDLKTSFPDSLWLKVTGTNMTIICQSLIQLEDQLQKGKTDMMLIIILAAVSSGVFAFAIILICCICKYRRQKKNQNICKSPTITPLVMGHDEVVYSEPGKQVPTRYKIPKEDYYELENTYEEPTNPNNNLKTDDEAFGDKDSVYNHLREKPDLLPSNIYNTTSKNEYSSFRRNEGGRHVIDNVYDI